MKRPKHTLVFILIFVLFLIAGCSKNSPSQKPSDTNNQKPKAPTELKSLSTELDKLISELDKKLKMQETSSLQQNIELNPQSKTQERQTQQNQTQGGQTQNQTQGQKSTQTGQSGSQSTQGDQTQGNQNPTGQSNNQSTGQTQTTKPTASQAQPTPNQSTQTKTAAASDWQKEFTSLKSIHTNWNNIMPEAVQAGMSVEARNQFETTLQQLTQNVSQQKLIESLSSALMLYKNYADMTQIFTTSIPSEYYQVKYETMATIFEASQKNWAVAEDHAGKLKQHWTYLSAQAQDTDKKMLSRTEFAIMDLEQAVKTKQKELIIIKGEIAMNNLKSLEGKLSSQSSGQTQEQGSSQTQNKS